MGVLHTVGSFLVAIAVLVAVHEFGHFWVARRLGVKVLRFSIGFGRTIWSHRGGVDGTEFVLAAVPLGGYVKMLDEREEEVAPHEVHRAFNRQPLWKRIAVVAAGPVFNFLFAIVAYGCMYLVGVSGLKPIVGEVRSATPAAIAGLERGDELLAVNDRPVTTWEGVIHAVLGETLDGSGVELVLRRNDGSERSLTLDLSGTTLDDITRGGFFDTLGMEPERPSLPAVIGQVETGGPADRAGLRAGDFVQRCGGEPVSHWGMLVECVRSHPGEVLPLELERDGVTIALVLVPETVADESGASIGRVGAGVQDASERVASYYTVERYGPVEALDRAVAKTGEVIGLTMRLLWKMLTLQLSLENLSGPISIAQYAGISADIGFSRFLDFLGLVSVSLGILNLLPIPVLDGGHLLYYLIEAVRRRPLSEEAQFVGQRLGIALLVGLMSLALYNDVVRLFG